MNDSKIEFFFDTFVVLERDFFMERIGFIGAGRVGRALAEYMNQSTIRISGFYSKTVDSAGIAADSLGVKTYLSIDELLADSTMVFITTPDSAIVHAVNNLTSSGLSLEGKWILHCSGALDAHILDPCLLLGAQVASLHPLQAFSGVDDVKRLKNTFFTIEMNKECSQERMKSLLELMGNPYRWITPDQKALYHGAAVVMSNYMVTLIEEGLTYLRTIGFDDEASIQMMMPLIQGTISNVAEKGTVDGLTGPLVRGDDGVITKHMTAITNELDGDAKAMYQLLAKQTLKMIRNKRLDEESAKRIEDALKLNQ